MNTNLRIPQRRSILALAAVVSFSFIAAACGSDSNSSTATVAPAASQTSVKASGSAETTPMTEASSAMAPTGPGCAAVPADGAGSFGGMAQDPAATAASNNPLLSTLVTAVKAAGLVDTLNGAGPFTIFAPTNDAFAKIPADQLQAILADKAKLTSILTLHVVSGKMTSADLIKAGKVTTLNGADLTITDVGGTLMVNGAKTLCMNVPTANAEVHIIDTVLVP